MEQKIREIMAEIFEVPAGQLTRSFTQQDIENWDSLRHLNLIVELESVFDVSYEPEEIGAMNTFDKVVAITKKKASPDA